MKAWFVDPTPMPTDGEWSLRSAMPASPGSPRPCRPTPAGSPSTLCPASMIRSSPFSRAPWTRSPSTVRLAESPLRPRLVPAPAQIRRSPARSELHQLLRPVFEYSWHLRAQLLSGAPVQIAPVTGGAPADPSGDHQATRLAFAQTRECP